MLSNQDIPRPCVLLHLGFQPYFDINIRETAARSGALSLLRSLPRCTLVIYECSMSGATPTYCATSPGHMPKRFSAPCTCMWQQIHLRQVVGQLNFWKSSGIWQTPVCFFSLGHHLKPIQEGHGIQYRKKRRVHTYAAAVAHPTQGYPAIHTNVPNQDAAVLKSTEIRKSSGKLLQVFSQIRKVRGLQIDRARYG